MTEGLTRADLLLAAAHSGLARVSFDVEAIAERAGVSKPTVHRAIAYLTGDVDTYVSDESVTCVLRVLAGVPC